MLWIAMALAGNPTLTSVVDGLPASLEGRTVCDLQNAVPVVHEVDAFGHPGASAMVSSDDLVLEDEATMEQVELDDLGWTEVPIGFLAR